MRSSTVINIPGEWVPVYQRLVYAELPTNCLQSLVKGKSRFTPLLTYSHFVFLCSIVSSMTERIQDKYKTHK